MGGQSFLSFLYFRISMIRRIMSTASADNAHTSIIVIRILHLPPERILRGKEETSPPTVRVFNSYGCFSFGTMYRFNYTFSDFHCQITIRLQKRRLFCSKFFLTTIKNYDILKIKKQPCRRCAPMLVLSLT